MVDTTTTDYSFVQPEVGASEDTWGAKLNANWQKLDDLLSLTTLPNATSVVNRKNGDDRYLQASTSDVVTPRVTFADGLVLSNNKYLYGTETGGSLRGLASIDNANRNRFGNNNLETILDGTIISLAGNTTAQGSLTATGPFTSGGGADLNGATTVNGALTCRSAFRVQTTTGATIGEINPLDGTGVRIGSITNSDVFLRHNSNIKWRITNTWSGTDQRLYIAAGGTGNEPDFGNIGAEGVRLSYANDAGQVWIKTKNTASVNANALIVQQGTTTNLNIKVDGDVVNKNNSYGSISDLRLKENVTDATAQLADILSLRVVNFNFIDDTTKQIGLIAQEVQEVKPGLVAEGEDGMLGVKYSVLVPILLKAVQELAARVEALEGA